MSRRKVKYFYKGENRTVPEIAHMMGISAPTLYRRLRECNHEIQNVVIYKIKTYSFNGKEYTIKELSNMTGLSDSCMSRRLKKGMSITELMAYTPQNRRKHIKYEGELLPAKEVAARIGLSKSTLLKKLREGKTIEEIEAKFKKYVEKTTPRPSEPINWDKFYKNFMNRPYMGDIKNLTR